MTKRNWSQWNWPDCFSGPAELLLLHQIRLIDYNQISHSNLPARTLNISQLIFVLFCFGCLLFIYFFLHARVWLSFHGWQQAPLAQMGAQRLFSLEVKTQTKSRNAKGSYNGSLFHRVCLLNSNKHTAAGGHKQRRPRRRTGGWQKAPSTAARPRVPLWTLWNIFTHFGVWNS